MKEEIQAKQYHANIEEEEEFDDEIEESEEETITLDFDNGVAIQEGIIVGEGLYDKLDEIMKSVVSEAKVAKLEEPKPIIAKGMAFAYETPDTEPITFTNIVEAPEGYEEAAKEAELVDKVLEKVKEETKPEKSYRDSLNGILVDAVANRAIRSLMDAHHQLERDVYDSLGTKYNKLGKAYQAHQGAILKSIDSKQRELRKAYGYGGRISPDHIPDWAKPFVEEYIKNFVYNVCDLGDID